MTLIDFFVSAYYSKKKFSKTRIRIILNECGEEYTIAKSEYNTMKGYVSIEAILVYIAKYNKIDKESFFKTYNVETQ